jgi:trans-aconitate 2-methyltransferase
MVYTFISQARSIIMPYEFDGEKYKNASSHQKEWGNKIIAEFNFKGDEHILDLGCGDGVLTAELAAMVPQGSVTGIDGSNGMFDTARKLETSNLHFRQLDINQLDYKDEFDLIFSNATLHWVKDHDRLLGNVYRALKKGGALRFNFAADGNCSNFFRVVKEAIKKPEYADAFKSFEWPWYMPAPENYKVLIEKFPFREASVWGENADRYFPDVEAMVKWIDQPSLVPFLKNIPGDKKQDFRNYVVDQMIAAARQDDGRCFESFRRINARARK